MLAITQFEVYVLEHGRWTIHARYGSDQRKAAIMDARNTEYTTGFPTKVVAETYFPETNESELVTAYVSPKARELRENAKTARRPGRPQSLARGASAARGGSDARRRVGLRQYLMQGFVAAVFSLVAATISTVVISWGMKRSIEAGLPISGNLSTTILTYAYAVFFLFFFLSLWRSKLPLHRVLTYLWQQSPQKEERAEDNVKSLAAKIAPRVRPKQPSALALAEAERALDELKLMRGDPPSPPEVAVYDPPPLPAPAAEVSPQLRDLLAGETTAAQKKREKREQKERQEKEAKEKALAEQAAVEAAKQRAAAAEQAAVAAKKAAIEPLPLERAIIGKFAGEVLRPAVTGTMPDDPVTRRGVSLVMAGAAAALADSARAGDDGRKQLIEEGLSLFGMAPASIAAFLTQIETLVAVPANANLVNIGRSALSKHLEGEDVARILTVALAGWRTPFGQPAAPAPVIEPAPMEADLPDIYLLTELRVTHPAASDEITDVGLDARRDAAMGVHNSVVRSVLGTHHGHEVKHTGSGIFARFRQAGTAVAAAIEIQRRFTASAGSMLAVGVVEDSGHDDPLITAGLYRQAQTAVEQAVNGEILAEWRVGHAAGALPPQAPAGESDPTALVRIPTDASEEEPALYHHIPAQGLGAAGQPQAINAP